MEKADILSMNVAEIEGLMKGLNQPNFRAAQVFGWLHDKQVGSFNEMGNLPTALRKTLDDLCFIPECRVHEKYVSSKDGTVKFLNSFDGGVFVESVLMKYKHGYSVCISTQAGCRMGCKFCASAEHGLQRNLSAGEMCAQVYNAMREIGGEKLSGVVLMGCGEPLDNFDAVLRFVELITSPKGVNLGQRHITVSTCGLADGINALAELSPQFTLAVSLHAPFDDIRAELMPIAKRYPLAGLIHACRAYAEKTRRRVTFEYALISGLNDETTHAKALVKLLRGILCHVNLIPVNSARGGYTPTPRQEVDAFKQILEEGKIPVTIRRSLGNDVKAACGQLRAGVIRKPSTHRVAKT